MRRAAGAGPAWCAAAVTSVVVLSGGCDSKGQPADEEARPATPTQERTELEEPCPGQGTTLNLGSPYRATPFPAKFTTDGGDVYITARQWTHGGIFDPEVGRSGIYIGRAGRAPRYDEQSGRVANDEVETSVVEGTWSAVTLPAGRYWLWSTTAGDVIARSCHRQGLSDPVPGRVLTPEERLSELQPAQR